MADTVFIRAIGPLSVDNVAIAPGEVAEIRAELLEDLVAIGEAEAIEAPPPPAPKSSAKAKAQ